MTLISNGQYPPPLPPPQKKKTPKINRENCFKMNWRHQQYQKERLWQNFKKRRKIDLFFWKIWSLYINTLMVNYQCYHVNIYMQAYRTGDLYAISTRDITMWYKLETILINFHHESRDWKWNLSLTWNLFHIWTSRNVNESKVRNVQSRVISPKGSVI